MAEKIVVHDPRGYAPTVAGKRLAERVPDLAGKKVYLVDGRYENSDAFMAQMAEWFKQHMPKTTVQGIRTRESLVDDPVMRAAVVADGHAAILGVGICSACSPAVVGLALKLEQSGIPTIALHTQPFARLVKSMTKVEGMPTARQGFVPQPLVGRSPPQLREYIEGDDPVAKRPFMDVVLDALTKPLAGEDLTLKNFDRSVPRLLEADTEDNLRQLFIDNYWTDFLPIILPTEERVAAMLKGTSHAPDKFVGRLRPADGREFWSFDVEKVAVNAVMAGAKPEYLPVILAMAASGVTARHSSTTSTATMSVINGPIRNELNMNTGIGALGPYNHANSTIGRAHGLLSINLQGGSVPNDTYMGSLGNPLQYALAVAEAEERSPWAPLHVQRGFKPTDSAVTTFGVAGWYIIGGFGPRDTWEGIMRRSLAATDHFIPPLLVVDPLVAKEYAAMGFDTKEKFIDWMAKNGQLPARDFWDNLWVTTRIRPLAESGVEPHASKLKAAPDELVQMFDAKDIHIVVIGGETQAAWRMFSGSRRVETFSIDEWR